MKTWRMFIGVAEIVLAVIAVIAALSSNHPNAWFGFVLAAMFGAKGLLYILSANEVDSENEQAS